MNDDGTRLAAINELCDRALLEARRVEDSVGAEVLWAKWLARNGELRRRLGDLDKLLPEERRGVGLVLNSTRASLEQLLKPWRDRKLGETELTSAGNISLPGDWVEIGSRSPITLVEEKLEKLFTSMGFDIVVGPEIETEYFCFDSLNIPKEHPARDLQDTFFIGPGTVLRTHTTSVQARLLADKPESIRAVSLGRVYRNEAVDAQHLAMFHQFEGVWLEEGLTLADLMGLLRAVASGIFGPRRLVRFKPKYYPYTEPSLGVDVSCQLCSGKGSDVPGDCPACHGAGWITVIGAGMVHRNVLLEFGYDSGIRRGLAFGIGTSRLAAQLYGATSIKSLYENDLNVTREYERIAYRLATQDAADAVE